jgi:hypothetical protein
MLFSVQITQVMMVLLVEPVSVPWLALADSVAIWPTVT